jgi:hypothetical protein
VRTVTDNFPTIAKICNDTVTCAVAAANHNSTVMRSNVTASNNYTVVRNVAAASVANNLPLIATSRDNTVPHTVANNFPAIAASLDNTSQKLHQVLSWHWVLGLVFWSYHVTDKQLCFAHHN